MLKIEFKDVEFLPCDTPRDKRDREHIAGIELCREMIKQYFGVEFDSFRYNDNGKPFVDKEGIFFNISHSKGRVVCAVSDKPVDEAVKILTELGLLECIDLLPTALSGGMRRRVALARVLFYDGDILLLDECFTGLDDDTRRSVAETVNVDTKDKTLVLITHDREEADLLHCDVLSLDDFQTKSL